jgi:hypothetical protein
MNNCRIYLENIDIIKSNNIIDKIKVNDGLKKHIIHRYEGLENPKFRIFLCKEYEELYLVVIKDDNDNIELFINDELINLIKSDANIFRIKEETLINGLIINIPDYNYSDLFDINTRTAECNIIDRDCVIELF